MDIDWLLRLIGKRENLGRRGERLAAAYLKKQGYKILARNLRNRVGEIDILAQAPAAEASQKLPAIVVVEVKSGAGPMSEAPEFHVNRQKEKKLAMLASVLQKRYGWRDRAIRFDVIGVQWADAEALREPMIRHHPGAFSSWL